MKECKYCRTKYDDNLSACPSCGGTKVITAQEKAEDAALYQKEIENRERAIAEPGIRKKRVFGIIAAIIAVVIVGVVAISYNTNKPLSNGMTKDEGETILAEGIAFYNDGDYKSAIECFVQLPSDSKQYDEAQSMLAKCEDEYSASVVEKANGYAENGEYEMAINLLNNAGNILPNNAAISAAHNAIFAEYKELICDNAYSESETFASNGDYPSAIITIDNAVALVGHDDELAAKRNVYTNTYVSQVIASAESQYIEYNAESIYIVERILEDALSVLPNNPELTDALQLYVERQPISIMSLPLKNGIGGFHYGLKDYGTQFDEFGNEYSVSISTESWGGDYRIGRCYGFTYVDLDYQYSKITGTLFQSQKYANAAATTKLKIFACINENSISDTKQSWEFEISGGDGPIEIECDVSGCKYVEISWEHDTEDDSVHYAYLADLYAWK